MEKECLKNLSIIIIIFNFEINYINTNNRLYLFIGIFFKNTQLFFLKLFIMTFDTNTITRKTIHIYIVCTYFIKIIQS